jgi:hypothetical protein
LQSNQTKENNICHVYGVTINGVWISNRIYWTLLHGAHDYSLHITITQTLVSTVTSSLLSSSFQTANGRCLPSSQFPNCCSFSYSNSKSLTACTLSKSLHRMPTLVNSPHSRLTLDTSHSRLTCLEPKSKLLYDRQSFRLGIKPLETHEQRLSCELKLCGHSPHVTSSLVRG